MQPFLEMLRSIDPDRINLDDAVALMTFWKSMKATYTEYKLDPPEWVADKIDVLNRWIGTHRRDSLALRLKEAKAAQAALATPDEKRAALAAKIAALEEQLNGVPA